MKMQPLTQHEIEKGIAFRGAFTFEICGDCHEAFHRGDGKLGYGFNCEAKDSKGSTRYPNGHELDGRGRCYPCLQKRGVFGGQSTYQKPNLRDIILAKMNRRGSGAEGLAKLIGVSAVEVREELMRLTEEGRVANKGKLYWKLESPKESEGSDESSRVFAEANG
jgi:hypothetical protein